MADDGGESAQVGQGLAPAANQQDIQAAEGSQLASKGKGDDDAALVQRLVARIAELEAKLYQRELEPEPEPEPGMYKQILFFLDRAATLVPALGCSPTRVAGTPAA